MPMPSPSDSKVYNRNVFFGDFYFYQSVRPKHPNFDCEYFRSYISSNRYIYFIITWQYKISCLLFKVFYF